MNHGSIVYLCENLFSEFRELYDWAKSSENPWRENFKFDTLRPELENKFLLLGFDRVLNKAVIAFDNQNVNDNLENGMPFIKPRNCSFPNVYISSSDRLISPVYIREVFSEEQLCLDFTGKQLFKRKSFLFGVDFDKLSEIK